jgi:hypothetical protein
LPANALVKCLQSNLSTIQLWQAPTEIVSPILAQAISAAKRWLESCKKLTSFFWQNNANQKWNGQPLIPSLLAKFLVRIEEVCFIMQPWYLVNFINILDKQNSIYSSAASNFLARRAEQQCQE